MNVDGILSFRQNLYRLNEPFPLPNDVLVAPFWDNVANGGYYRDRYAHVLYRFTTEQSVLDEIATNISSAFDVDFTPVTAFIATWDGVRDLDNDYYYFYYNYYYYDDINFAVRNKLAQR